ncbi:MAG: hypothetical protein DHS80DRAFT_30555 [Piptocephalis tieghemiana]|nr:MAG: hypothetical protein DHS80DRAFT_30555 [Piptocephalis tieghemiana]
MTLPHVLVLLTFLALAHLSPHPTGILAHPTPDVTVRVDSAVKGLHVAPACPASDPDCPEGKQARIVGPYIATDRTFVVEGKLADTKNHPIPLGHSIARIHEGQPDLNPRITGAESWIPEGVSASRDHPDPSDLTHWSLNHTAYYRLPTPKAQKGFSTTSPSLPAASSSLSPVAPKVSVSYVAPSIYTSPRQMSHFYRNHRITPPSYAPIYPYVTFHPPPAPQAPLIQFSSFPEGSDSDSEDLSDHTDSE